MLTLTAFSVLTRFLGFLYKIYLSRIMSTYELGIYSLTISVYMVLITIVASSIPLTISKITSTNKSQNKENLTHYSVTSSLIFSVFISTIIVIIILLSKPLIITLLGSKLSYQIILSLVPSIIFSALYSQIRGYLWGYENYFSVSMVEFVEQILRIAFCMIFVSLNIFDNPTISVGIALSIACGISTIYGFILYFKNNGKFKFQRGYFKEIIKSSLPLTGLRIFSSILQPIIAILLPIILNNFGINNEQAVSELGVVMGMTMPILTICSTIIGSLCMILIPKISTYNENNAQKFNKHIDNYINFSILCSMLFIPIFMALGVPICNLMFKNSLSGIYLSYSAWIILPMGIAQITTSILNALNQEKKSFIYYIISTILMFVSLLILPKFIGTMTMLYGIGLSNIILAILNVKKINNITNNNYKIINKLTKQLFICLPVILLTKLTYEWSHIIMGNILSIIISAIISTSSYFILAFTFEILDFNIIKRFFIENSKKTKSTSNY